MDLDDPDDKLDYNALIDEFGEEDVQVANYYLHRYKIYKLVPDAIEVDWDDLTAFLVIEEEIGNRQAVEAVKMEQKSKG